MLGRGRVEGRGAGLKEEALASLLLARPQVLWTTSSVFSAVKLK